MTEFKRFKSKITRDALLKSGLVALGAGLFLVGALGIALRLLGIVLSPLWYVLIGVFVACACFTVVFLTQRPSDVRVARLLDSTLALDERVQTMLAYQACDGAMYDIQREDTERHLSLIPTKTIKFRRLVATILAVVLGASLFTGSLFVPVVATDDTIEETPVTDWERQYLLEQLRALVSRVGSDGTFIDDGLKKGMLEELGILISVVEEKDLMSEMRLAAIDTVIHISQHLAIYNTATPIADLMLTSNTDEIYALGEALASLKSSSVRSAMDALCERFLAASDRALEIEYLTEEIDAYLRASGVDAGDDIYVNYKLLTGALRATSENPTDAAIENAFSSIEETLADELLWQQVNETTVRYAVSKLYALFSLTDDDFANLGVDDSIIHPDEIIGGTPPELDEDELSPEGGYSEGGTRFASDDEVFYPEENRYAKYSEIISIYFGRFEAQRNDDLYGDILKDILVEYYNSLY